MPNMPAAQSAETDLQREALTQTYSASAELSHSYNAKRSSESLQQRQHQSKLSMGTSAYTPPLLN